jgi:hypothetical protein
VLFSRGFEQSSGLLETMSSDRDPPKRLFLNCNKKCGLIRTSKKAQYVELTLDTISLLLYQRYENMSLKKLCHSALIEFT